MNYYPRHIGDYLKDTAHLSLLEHGIYGRLLDVYYTKEGPIDASQVERLICARTDEERSALRDVLNEFFERDGETYRHSRCDREIAVMQEKQSKAQASAAKRWDKERSNANAMPTHSERIANAVPTQCEGNAPNNQEPITNTTIAPKEHRGRGSRLAPEWEPSDADMQFALQSIGNSNATATELAKFRDYWRAQPGQKGVKTDWDATWRNWVRKAVGDAKARATFRGRAEPSETVPSNPNALYIPPPPLTADEREAAELARQRAMQAINRRQAA